MTLGIPASSINPTPIEGGAPYARVVNGVVSGPIYLLPNGWQLADVFTPEVASEYVAVPADVNVAEFWTYANGTFSPPAQGEG